MRVASFKIAFYFILHAEVIIGNHDAAACEKANAAVLEMSAAIEQLIFKGSGGDHASGVELKEVVPEWSHAFELLLREKEEHLMSETKGMAGDALLAVINTALAPIRDGMGIHAAYICSHLKKRPFGNIRMYVAALKAASSDAEFAAVSSAVERACGGDLWAKIVPFLA